MPATDTPERDTSQRHTPERQRFSLRSLGWQPILLATLLAALAAAAVAVLLGGASDGAEPPASPDGSIELTPVDELRDGNPMQVPFRTNDGDEATLAESIEGPAVVNFFASWCAPCVAEMPEFEAVSQELAGRVTFFGLAVSDRPEDARRIVEQTGVTYDWARDVGGDVVAAAGAINMPTTMLVDADGEVVEVHSGALDAEELRELLEEHLGITA